MIVDMNSAQERRRDMSKPYVIGVLGGMGTYATIDLFERYADNMK